MTATAAQIAEIRRMVAEPTSATYSDTLIQEYIERYPCLDERGTEPYYYTYVAGVPTPTANTDWIATYDLHAAAADIWEEKAAVWANKYDFNADGGAYSRSQVYQQMMSKAKYHRSRSKIKTIKLVMSPPQSNEETWQGNLPEPED